MDIYIHRDGEQSGPYSAVEVQERVKAGRLQSSDLAWHEGAAEWQPISTIPSLNAVQEEFALVVPPPMPVRRLGRQAAEVVQAAPATKTCPFCAEPIRPEAKKCKHCGETVDVALRAAEEAKRASERQQQPNVYMNAAVGLAAPQKANFPHIMHLFLTIFTAGIWLPIWLLAYIFRSRSKYG